MKPLLAAPAVLSSVVTLLSLGAIASTTACGRSGRNEDRSGSGTSGASGTAGSSGTLGSSGRPGTTGKFWYVNADVKRVGIGDTDANDEWSESIEETPIGIAIGAGSAWVLTAKGDVLRYDLATHVRTKTINAAKFPAHIVFAAGAVWVDDKDDGAPCVSPEEGSTKVLRIDPATDTVTKRIAVSATSTNACANRVVSLTADGSNVYAVIDNSFGILRIDTATSTVAQRMALGTGAGYGTGGGAAGGGAVWVHNRTTHALIKVDPVTLAVISTTPVPDTTLVERMWATADAVYLINKGDLLRASAADPATQGTFPLFASLNDLQLRDNVLYGFFESLEGKIVAFDPSTLVERKRATGLIAPQQVAFIP